MLSLMTRAETKVNKVKRGPGVEASEAGALGLGPFRPSLDADDDALSLDGDLDEETKEMQGETIEPRDLLALFDLLHRCWAEDPNLRPSFGTIKADLKRINPTRRAALLTSFSFSLSHTHTHTLYIYIYTKNQKATLILS